MVPTFLRQRRWLGVTLVMLLMAWLTISVTSSLDAVSPTPRAPRNGAQVYLPLVLKDYPPSGTSTPTPTATRTSTPTATPTNAPFVVTSSAFTEGGSIPTKYGYNKYGCPGQNISPPLTWTTPPSGTQSFALIMDDPDAPGGTFVHWVLFNISAATTNLPENVGVPSGAIRGANAWSELGYGGPCPPPGPPHRYYFKLYALDITLSLAEGASKAQVETAMTGAMIFVSAAPLLSATKSGMVGTAKLT